MSFSGYSLVFITCKLIHHTLNVSRKSIGIIYKSSFCLSPLSLRTLYFSLVYPYLIYCITVLGSTYNYQTNLKRIITRQKKKSYQKVFRMFLSMQTLTILSEIIKFYNFMIFIYFKLLSLCFCIKRLASQ